MTDDYHVFLSHSRNDSVATADLYAQLRRHDLDVFKDDESIEPGDVWLDRLQSVLEGCGAFVVLVGRDGVGRWIGAETQVALNRHFAPHDDAQRLPIFPILLDGTTPETLPAFLRLFQVTRWNAGEPLAAELLANIRTRNSLGKPEPITGSPFVGLAAYRPEQAHLFFGRQKETLDALACFRRQPLGLRVKWLEINGNSGSGKSSLMNAGLLPLIERGWLWPSTGYERWLIIGPMMPGEHSVGMLAESLARTFKAEMADIRPRMEADSCGLSDWLRTRKQDDTAFLLAIDQFEELFTFADPEERHRFDRLLSGALKDPDCPLFVISTVRADFLDRFAEDLPRLVTVQNRLGRSWKLAPISVDSLGEVIDGPARLAGLDVSEVKAAMVAEARGEPGALPLVENALHWLWEKREGNRLSGQLLTEQGGLAGILSGSADELLGGLDKHQRERALELLFRLVQVDPEAGRHTRRRISLAEAADVAGGGEVGRALVNRLAGERPRDGSHATGPLRLITISEEGATGAGEGGRWVNLIHETLIRGKVLGADGIQPYWPTLWTYVENNKQLAARRERLHLMAREWKDRRGFDRLFGLAGWSSLFGFRGLAAQESLEQRYLRWSRTRAAAEAALLATILGVVCEGVYWARVHALPLEAMITRWRYKAGLQEVPLPAFVKIPSGSFMMGSDWDNRGKPVHRVTFTKDFRVGETEVTFVQYDAFCKATGSRPPDSGWGRGKQPVIDVDWYDARDYARWMEAMTGWGCRLPSEAEWEYAARAGTETEYALPAPNGSDDIKGKGLANCADCGGRWDRKQTAPVGSFEGACATCTGTFSSGSRTVCTRTTLRAIFRAACAAL